MAAGVCPDWTDIDCVGPLLMHAAIVLAGVGREADNLLVVVPYYKADIYLADNDALCRDIWPVVPNMTTSVVSEDMSPTCRRN